MFKKVLLSCTVLTFLLYGNFVFAAEFSSDVVNIINGKETDKGVIYVKNNLRRVESGTGDASIVTIIDVNKKEGWLLIPGEKVYTKLDIGFFLNKDVAADKANKKVVGRESLDGYKCTKTEYTHNNSAYGVLTQWYSDKLEFPIKIVHNMDGKEISKIEYKNIKMRKINDSLFSIPMGYKEK